MAHVYLAQDVKHDRQVAVKVFRPELAASLGSERFLAHDAWGVVLCPIRWAHSIASSVSVVSSMARSPRSA